MIQRVITQFFGGLRTFTGAADELANTPTVAYSADGSPRSP
ncbi:MAG: hypothetical protein ACRDPY_30900 [Streptosporangiaceae bacterium]